MMKDNMVFSLIKAFFKNEIRRRGRGKGIRGPFIITRIISLFLGANFSLMSMGISKGNHLVFTGYFLFLYFIFQLLLISLELKRFLFSPKDNALLLLSPVKKSTLLTARFLFVYMHSLSNGVLIAFGGALTGALYFKAPLFAFFLFISILFIEFYSVFIAIMVYMISLWLMGKKNAERLSVYINALFSATIYVVFLTARESLGVYFSGPESIIPMSLLSAYLPASAVQGQFPVILLLCHICAACLILFLTWLLFGYIYGEGLRNAYEKKDADEIMGKGRLPVAGTFPVHLLLDRYVMRSRELKGRMITFLLMLAVIIFVNERRSMHGNSFPSLIAFLSATSIYFALVMVNMLHYSTHRSSAQILAISPHGRGHLLKEFYTWTISRIVLPISMLGAVYLAIKSGIFSGIIWGAFLFFASSAVLSLMMIMNPVMPLSKAVNMRAGRGAVMLNMLMIVPVAVLGYFLASGEGNNYIKPLISLIFLLLLSKINTVVIQKKNWRK